MRTMKRYRDRFFRHIREYVNDELLSGVHGIVWRLEEGGRGGSLHLHLVIFYSTGRSGDVKIGKELGEYWIDEITHGWGDYWNSNARKSEFEHRWGVGVGLVGRNNHEMRESLRKIIGCYMVKTTQVPKSRGIDDKLFGIVRFRRNRRR